MPTKITYVEARTNLDNLCDRAVENGEVIIITRPHGNNAVLISKTELESLLEKLYLLRSPIDSSRLLTALKTAKSKVVQPQIVEEIATEAIDIT